MIRLITFSIFMLFSFSVFASDTSISFSGFFEDVASFFNGIWFFLTVEIPTAITNFFVWLISWLIFLKYTMFLHAIEFASQIATSFLDLVELNSMINLAVADLPSDVRSVLVDVGFFEGLTILIEAVITRFVYNMITF